MDLGRNFRHMDGAGAESDCGVDAEFKNCAIFAEVPDDVVLLRI